ncbi:MAG TPA: lysylphosphatidylglycerol synthase transmembrane domain-containing protein [Chitinophagaceae bacterium]|nr:lysylphosphatidylglycerol synthase transmembrane domain-containing protein [Chitinophagaceae bacterium]
MEPESLVIPAKKESAASRVLKLLLKIGITILCFWYISKKIDFTRAWEAFRNAGWGYLLLAVLSFSFSKLLAAFRLNINFRNINVKLPEWRNIKLYWLGMFYNLFLPGSISGDAYKVGLLNRRYGAPYKKTSAAVLLDRFSGLLALGIILSVYGVIVLHNTVWDALLMISALVAIVGLNLVVRFFFKDFMPGFWPTFFWGMAVQVFQVVCLYCVLLSLHIPLHQPEWIFIFLVASVVSVLPISLGGGLGTREVVFAEGARFFGLDPHLGVIISLLFYLSNLLSSVGGAYFVFHDPLKEVSMATVV